VSRAARLEESISGARLARVRRELGGDEHVLPSDAAVADGSTDLLLVAVHAGGVQMPVADIERAPDDRLA
jgi:hypothetical protein